MPIESYGRIQLWSDLMRIRRVEVQDAGRYVCITRNQYGELQAETHLSVTSKLLAHILPRLQVMRKKILELFNKFFLITHLETSANFVIKNVNFSKT